MLYCGLRNNFTAVHIVKSKSGNHSDEWIKSAEARCPKNDLPERSFDFIAGLVATCTHTRYQGAMVIPCTRYKAKHYRPFTDLLHEGVHYPYTRAVVLLLEGFTRCNARMVALFQQ